MNNAFKIQLLETTAALITAAFGLVAALAWNETIKSVIAICFSSDSTVWGNLIYAVIVTIIAVAATMLIARAIGKLKAVEEKKHPSEEKKEE